MNFLGVNSYRFSVSWSRVLPSKSLFTKPGLLLHCISYTNHRFLSKRSKLNLDRVISIIKYNQILKHGRQEEDLEGLIIRE